MPQPLTSLDWSIIQTFLSVAEEGSYSAAARQLGLSQPTVGRHIRAAEDSLGVTLFDRRAHGVALTPAGARLVEPAQRMKDAANDLAVTAAGAEESLAGTVRLTASVFMAHYVLPPILSGLRQRHPEIAIELVATDASENLLFREADIAIRMYRPRQLEVVARKIGKLQLGFFASRNYLDRSGRPTSLETLTEFDFVGFDRSSEMIEGFREAGVEVDRDFFGTRCDSHRVYWDLVRAGCGLGISQRRTALQDPQVEEIAPPVDLPVLEVWLSAHETLRQTPRVARVWDHLAETLTEACDPE